MDISVVSSIAAVAGAVSALAGLAKVVVDSPFLKKMESFVTSR
jgi:hypothetical protein